MRQSNKTPYDYHQPNSCQYRDEAGGESWDSVTLQLAIWTHAQFKRWRMLVKEAGNSDTQMPVIPLIVVQGSNWHLLAATQDVDGNMVSAFPFHSFLLTCRV